MEITIEFDNEEDKKWYEENMDHVVDNAIFARGATVMVDGWYHVYEGYNHAYHTVHRDTTSNISDFTTQSKLTGD